MQRGLGWYFARTALLFVIFFWFGIIVADAY